MKSGFIVFAAAALVGSVVALFAGDGNGWVALGPLIAFGLLWAIWRLPLRGTLMTMMFLALALNSPLERPHAGRWTPPWSTLCDLLFNNLHHTLHIPFLRFSAMEFLIFYVVGIAAWRRATGSRIDPPPPPAPRPLIRALGLSFVAVLALWGYGLARGGADFTQSVWQMRALLVTPVVAGLFAHVLREPRDQQTLWRVIIWAALVKVALGAYFYFAICRPAGLQPPYVTTHTDSVLFCLAIVVCVANWWECPTKRNAAFAAAIVPLVGVGLVLNDRRLAYVSLGAMLLTLVLVSPWNRAKRAMARALLVCTPLVLAYGAVGWSSSSRLFTPVQVLRSVTTSDTGSDRDRSTEFRDLENQNLVTTLEPHPLLGQGFGHGYNEVIILPSIAAVMPFYRFLPHNSVLWLFTLGGALGFSALWLYLVVGVFFAARAYHHAVRPLDRASMLVALCAVVAYLNQAFGDMGVLAYGSVFTIGPAVGLAGTLACRVGAWAGQRDEVAPS